MSLISVVLYFLLVDVLKNPSRRKAKDEYKHKGSLDCAGHYYFYYGFLLNSETHSR